MKNKLRSINTRIYSDTWFSELNKDEKLLFIYLLTNDCTNMLGIYEISIKRISFETGLTGSEILKGFETLSKASKGLYLENYVILFNFLKNQNLNQNMKTSAIQVFNQLPNSLLSKLPPFVINPLKAFESLTQWFESLRKVEREYKIELEEESEGESKTHTFESSTGIVVFEESKPPIARAPLFSDSAKEMAIFGVVSMEQMSMAVCASYEDFEAFAFGWWQKKKAAGTENYNTSNLKTFLMNDYEKHKNNPQFKTKIDVIREGMRERGVDFKNIPTDLYI